MLTRKEARFVLKVADVPCQCYQKPGDEGPEKEIPKWQEYK